MRGVQSRLRAATTARSLGAVVAVFGSCLNGLDSYSPQDLGASRSSTRRGRQGDEMI